ncbi:MAG: hypothetical protein JWQ28_2681 [Pedobacter sp.]|jgi:hypothetical protein|nr:hypothetical protein [Pedobacter sp.]
MKSLISFQLPRQLAVRTGFLVLFLVNGLLATGQVSAVNTLQNLSFGTFSQGVSGGTITVSNTGSITSTGTVFPLTFGSSNSGSDVSQAIFEVEAVAGTVISISNGPDVNLTGSNGGTMILHLGASDPRTPLAVVSETGRTSVSLGGTLTIGNAASTPPGAYTGTFYITFNNE